MTAPMTAVGRLREAVAEATMPRQRRDDTAEVCDRLERAERALRLVQEHTALIFHPGEDGCVLCNVRFEVDAALAVAQPTEPTWEPTGECGVCGSAACSVHPLAQPTEPDPRDLSLREARDLALEASRSNEASRKATCITEPDPRDPEIHALQSQVVALTGENERLRAQHSAALGVAEVWQREALAERANAERAEADAAQLRSALEAHARVERPASEDSAREARERWAREDGEIDPGGRERA